MKYIYLLIAGISVSAVHFYLVWHHRANRKYSISEYAILDKRSHYLYMVTHFLCDVLFLLFSYQFFIVENNLPIAFYLNVLFAVLDATQAVLPSKGKTEKFHFTSAYISWVSYLLSGVIALLKLNIAQPYLSIAIILLVPILIMFFYMHINRSKLYPYQLSIVPLFVIYMLIVVLGTNSTA